jgi:catechol 2,3-dioxygenase-like lactoylglutathione lyase family enzyme
LTQPLTYGLTHLALIVKDVDASIAFYNAVLGVRIMYRKPGFGQIQTLDSNDIIVFEEKNEERELIGRSGGILHFGFRLRIADDLQTIVNRVIKAGGIVTEQGEFCPGEPYVFFEDPDGYLVEVWYELENA